MRNRAKRILQIFIIALSILIIVAYSYLKMKDLVFGTQITVFSPKDGESVLDELITVKGTANHLSTLLLNGRAITTDLEGNFEEQLLVGEGYTILEISAVDTFGRHIEKRVNISYKKTSH